MDHLRRRPGRRLIARAALEVAPHAKIIDAGRYLHTPRRDQHRTRNVDLQSISDDPTAPADLRAIATAVTDRGHEIEQEEVMRAVMDQITGLPRPVKAATGLTAVRYLWITRFSTVLTANAAAVLAALQAAA